MSREQLKNWAKNAMGRTYWKSVLVALILSATVGSSGSSGGSSSSSSGESYGRMSEDEILIFVGVFLVVMAIALVFAAIGMAVKALALNPLHIGCQSYFCEGLENPEVSLGLLGKGFRTNYKNIVKTMFFRDLYLFLWSMFMWIPIALFIGGTVVVVWMEENMQINSVTAGVYMIILLVLFFVGLIVAMIPWIIKTYEYLMVPYILVDNPDMDRKEVFALTKEMMTGHKWEAFVLNISFIGWYALGFFTCGVLYIFYVEPYKAYTLAAYYKVRNQKRQAQMTPDYSYNYMLNGQN